MGRTKRRASVYLLATESQRRVSPRHRSSLSCAATFTCHPPLPQDPGGKIPAFAPQQFNWRPEAAAAPSGAEQDGDKDEQKQPYLADFSFQTVPAASNKEAARTSATTFQTPAPPAPQVENLENMSTQNSKGSGTSGSVGETMSRVRRSKVWEHFEVDLVMVGGIPKAVCKYCGLQLINTRNSGTSSLSHHIAESCPKIDEENRKSFVATLRKKPSNVGFVFDLERSRSLMAKYCIHAEVPFRKFEDPYFQEWMESMQPTFKVIGRQTLRNDCLSIYEQIKAQLRTEFELLDSRVCLTSDMWTSAQKLGYMCVTAHYIDANFALQKKIISFKDVKYPHSGIAIEEALCRCLADWGIKRKLFTLTLDNAANNTKAITSFLKNQDHSLMFGGREFHVKCCAHILNILVQDGIMPIKLAIEKIRDLVRHIDSSPSRIQSFNAIAAASDLPRKSGLALDIPSCWNSTYKMIGEALKYKGILSKYANESSELQSPTDAEWANAEAICEFLKAFEEATKTVSADRKPTTHLFLYILLCIRHALSNPQWQSNDAMQKLGVAMTIKFDKYWQEQNLNMALVIATVLDPTKKMDYMDFFFEKYCVSEDNIEENVECVKDMMKKYFQKYIEHANRINEQPVSRGYGLNLGSHVLGKRKIEEEFAQYKSKRRACMKPKSKLDTYIEEPCENHHERFDILAWWKTNTDKYPILSAMARDFLAIPLSTVSSESVFSCGGRIIGDTRSSLTPEMLEALVCAKDWLIKIPNNGGINNHS